MRSGWPESTPLGVARDWLLARVHDGAECPLCTQRAQVYDRQVYDVMAVTLVRAYADRGLDTFRMKHYVANTGDSTKLRYWGLIVEEKVVRPDGGRAGYWHVTEAGAAFVRGETTIPRYAKVYDNRLIKLHGDPVSIRDCLPKAFDLDELLRGAA